MRHIKDILSGNGFRYKKNLGQNFITDENLLDAIVRDAGVCLDDTVVEIGVGAGGLTRALSKSAKKVYGFEVDKSLKGVLDETLAGCQNAELIFCDVLELDDASLRAMIGDGSFKVVANLPYYITTPLIMRFLESGLAVSSLTVMVQKEVAERFTARAASKAYSAVTLSIDFYADARLVRHVGRGMFFPVPDVDSALLRLDVVPNKYAVQDRAEFLRLISSSFAMRRKTLINNISAAFGLDKQTLEKMFAALGFLPSVRGEALSMADFIRLYQEMTRPSWRVPALL